MDNNLIQNNKDLIKSFDNFSKNYNNNTNTFAHIVKEYVNQENLKLLLKNKFSNILDAGCGKGKWVPFLYKYCDNLTLLDISSKSLDVAKENNKKYLIKFVEGSIEKTKFDNNEFDFIIAEGGVISYTPNQKK